MAAKRGDNCHAGKGMSTKRQAHIEKQSRRVFCRDNTSILKHIRRSERRQCFGRAVRAVSAPSKIIHHGDTEDTELWFLPSLLRDLRASVVDIHPDGWAEGPYNTQDDKRVLSRGITKAVQR